MFQRLDLTVFGENSSAEMVLGLAEHLHIAVFGQDAERDHGVAARRWASIRRFLLWNVRGALLWLRNACPATDVA